MTDTALIINGKVDTVYRGQRKAAVEAKLKAAHALPKKALLVESRATHRPVCGGMTYRNGRFSKA